jgi:hypothetical protein
MGHLDEWHELTVGLAEDVAGDGMGSGLAEGRREGEGHPEALQHHPDLHALAELVTCGFLLALPTFTIVQYSSLSSEVADGVARDD